MGCLFSCCYDVDIDESESENKKSNLNEISNQININYYVKNNNPNIGDNERKGFYNKGGNCYLNSTMQCFVSLDKLNEYFLNCKEDRTLIENSRLCKAYRNFLLYLKDGRKNHNTLSILNCLQSVTNNFYKHGGNDPKAVVLDIMQNFQEELNCKNCNKNSENSEKSSENPEEDKIKTEKEAFEEAKKEEEESKTKITELFDFCEKTEIECPECGTLHYIFEFSNNILIPMKKYEQERSIKIDKMIDDNFREYTEEFYCEKCKDSKDGKTKKSIKIFPNYLVVILDRQFLKTKIDISRHELDLTNYSSGKDKKAMYDLKAVTLTNDSGASNVGHAIACCRLENGRFYLFNDSLISECHPEEKYGFNPYILFYEKRKYW